MIDSLHQLKKNLEHSRFVCSDNNGIMIRFLPLGVLEVYGKNPGKPYKHTYHLSKIGDNIIMKTCPSIMDNGSDFKVFMIKNHLTFESLKGIKETVHFTRLGAKID